MKNKKYRVEVILKSGVKQQIFCDNFKSDEDTSRVSVSYTNPVPVILYCVPGEVAAIFAYPNEEFEGEN